MTAAAGSGRPAYRRIVLKLSGEALAGSQGYHGASVLAARGALRAQPSTDDRRVLTAWSLHLCIPHAAAAARTERRTTASSTGTL